MNLPNYFLADLPQSAPLSPTIVREACLTLRRNRQSYLAHRSTEWTARFLAELAANWRRPDYIFRKLALEQGPASTGFSAETLAAGLDIFFAQFTFENFQRLLRQDLGHADRLDSMISLPEEEQLSRAATARAPEFLVHITAGNLPCPALHSMILGILMRSAQFLKCASGSCLIPRLFAHSIYNAEPKLGACLEIAEWGGGNAELEAELLSKADCLTVTGSDETLASVSARVPTGKRLVSYGHRVSFGYVASGSFRGGNARRVAQRAAKDVCTWDQLGCLSPHVFYVQNGGAASPEEFADLLAEELEAMDKVQPRGQLAVEAAAAITSRRSLYAVRAAYSDETRIWSSKAATAWTVVFEANPQIQLSCLHRFVYVKSVRDLDEALRGADPVHGKVSTVGLSAPEEESRSLSTALAMWGVLRICPIGKMQDPPLTWRHDGRPSLGDLVTWTDWEQD